MNVQAPEPLRLVSLRRDVDPPPQVLQTDGRRCHAAPASRVVGGSLELSAGESFAAWKGCLDDLTARGLGAPVLCIIDGNAGLRRAVGLVWPRAAVQRCCVHKLRNLERKAPKHTLAEIRDDFHRIVYAASGEAARAAYLVFERTWGKRCPGVVTSLREGGEELLTVEDPPHDERDRTAQRRIPPSREDAKLAAERRRGRGPALQPRSQRTDQVAEDRRLAEDGRDAQSAHDGSSMSLTGVPERHRTSRGRRCAWRREVATMTMFCRAQAQWALRVAVSLTIFFVIGVPGLVSAVEIAEPAPGFTLPATT